MTAVFDLPKDCDGNDLYIGDHIEEKDGHYLGVIKEIVYQEDDCVIRYKSVRDEWTYREAVPKEIRRLTTPCVEEIIAMALIDQAERDERDLREIIGGQEMWNRGISFKADFDIAAHYAKFLDAEVEWVGKDGND